jgi:hypothetical protein
MRTSPAVTKTLRARRSGLLAAVALALSAASCAGGGALPGPAAPRREPASGPEAAIEAQEICIGSSVASAGRLADVLYYRAAAHDDGRIAVGYFAFFSEERPWGNNWMTWTVIPALAVDLVYSRALLVAPGIQRAMYGKGDIEGVRVIYDVGESGELSVYRATADDGRHRIVELSRDDVFAIDPARPTFYTDVWSHQLGAKGARSTRDLAYRRCYVGDRMRPLPESLVREFNLANRAKPAHVEALAGARPLPDRDRMMRPIAAGTAMK